MKVAVFFERDGMLTQPAGENGSSHHPRELSEFHVRPGISDILEPLRLAGFRLFATTNQPGVTTGQPTRRDLDRMHAQLVTVARLDEVLMCPHAPDDACNCRKPLPGLLKEVAHKYKLDLEHSFVVSDRWEDAAMAESIGATSVLVRSRQNGTGHHDFVVDDLRQAVAKVLEAARTAGTLAVLSEQRTGV